MRSLTNVANWSPTLRRSTYTTLTSASTYGPTSGFMSCNGFWKLEATSCSKKAGYGRYVNDNYYIYTRIITLTIYYIYNRL